MITDMEIAWLAGLFDGEASFSWRKSKPQFFGVPTVRIGMTDLDIIERVRSILGGNIYVAKQRKLMWKPQYHLQWQGKKAVIIMEMLLP